MKIGLLSDTHSYLDERILDYFKNVDEIWHAGDVGNPKIIETLKKFKPLVGVYGNIDTLEVRKVFPEFQRFERENVSILMTHIAGKPERHSKYLAEELKKNGTPKMLVCGHSHLLLIQNDRQSKMLWVNPGACGNHGFHTVRTILRFELKRGNIQNMEVIEIGKRGKYK